MGFTDQKYYSSDKVSLGFGVVATATAGGANALTGLLRCPVFTKKTKLLRFRVEVVAAPAATTSGHLFAVLNGTSTIAVATLGTATAGQSVLANIAGQAIGQTDLTQIVTTATNPNGQTTVTTTRNALADIAAGVELTVTLVTTGTASGNGAGTYDAYIDTQENY